VPLLLIFQVLAQQVNLLLDLPCLLVLYLVLDPLQALLLILQVDQLPAQATPQALALVMDQVLVQVSRQALIPLFCQALPHLEHLLPSLVPCRLKGLL
jgi:hypothetical protein